MSEIRIRRVERRDLQACVALEERCYQPMEVAPPDFIERRIEVYPDGFYVAEVGSEIVGMINCGATHKDDITDEELKYLIGHVRNGKNGIVFSLAVDPRYRGNGIARKLMEKMIEVSGRKEKQKIILLCKDDLVDFYTALGFSYGGPSSSDFGGYVWHQMQYELPAPAWAVTSHHNSVSLSL
ncbi:GNAT family N-acetyltransferase [Desulfosediminicola ganghwensis]|uniref:GNAT family N-acetyltransferase n=1 Tax=Desulfosediminicola ganghwensis TaxID=2569540 RepID=UPI0010ACE5E9|nr:GNAT family N-acetyltransferase [Desulfosediminicola ganghwensis]